ESAARRGGQPDGRDVHGDRGRHGLPDRLRSRRRHHGDRRRADGHLYLLRSVRRLRLRHHHVFRRRAGWDGEHPRRLLGRADGWLRAAVLGVDPAPAAAERGDLRRVPDDRAAAAPRSVRAFGGARMRQGTGRQLRRNLTALAVVSVAYLVVTLFVANSYYQLILTLVPVWALFGVSWNILSGYGGQLSFGHASFFGIGAYTVTLTVVYWSLSPWLGILLGMMLGGLLAIRQNELAAEAAGINARLWKMRSLVVSGMMAAVAGGFYARVLVVVTPDSVFGMLVSAQAVVVTLFGGAVSVRRPLIGAAILVPLAET